jgi:hypothetical protein
MPTTRFARSAACALALFTLAAGCDDGPAMAEVTGTVTVDGQVPADGSSINFIPTDGKGPSAGALIQNGKYSAQVPVGLAKVEIRVPKPAKKAVKVEGPGGEGGNVEELLPARYNDQTELTFEVKRGKNEKNWELTAR